MLVWDDLDLVFQLGPGVLGVVLRLVARKDINKKKK